MFAYANALKNTPLEIIFINLGNKELYWIFNLLKPSGFFLYHQV